MKEENNIVESKEQLIRLWAARWDLQWSFTDLEACFEDVASIANDYYKTKGNVDVKG